MDTPQTPDLEELAVLERAALEAALEEMVHSGFGDLESKLTEQGGAVHKPAAVSTSALFGWW